MDEREAFDKHCEPPEQRDIPGALVAAFRELQWQGWKSRAALAAPPPDMSTEREALEARTVKRTYQRRTSMTDPVTLRIRMLDVVRHAISGRTADELWLETGALRAQIADLTAAAPALRGGDEPPALLPCGHQRSEMLVSAETGADLYCALCDAASARCDHEIEAASASGFEAGKRAAAKRAIEALREIAFLGLDCPAAAGEATDTGWYRSRAHAAIGIAARALYTLTHKENSND